MSDDRQDRVSRRAYELWEREGGEHGRHEDHWHRAASEIDGDAQVAAPDGTTLAVPADEVIGAAPPSDAAKPARKRAAPKASAAAPAKTPAKPRKPK